MKRSYLFLFLLLASLVFSSHVHAADATSFDPTNVMVQSVATSSIPVGTVIAWPSASWPADADNWLECNGQAISSAVYPELAALVGSRVPDYRGVFLRGHGSQTSTHYGTVAHSSAGLGELQGDTIREIWGWFPELISQGSTPMNYGAMSYGSPWSTGSHSKYSGNWMKRSADFYASRVTPVSDEVRPVNRSVRYLIRAK